MTNTRKYLIVGGIGDFLQCSSFVAQNPMEDYIVVTHYKKAPQFFKQFGAYIEQYLFSDLAEFVQVMQHVETTAVSLKKELPYCPRNKYCQKLPFTDQNIKDVDDLISKFKYPTLPIIGFHPFRSAFALNAAERMNIAMRHLPPKLITKIININPSINFLIFGLPHELELLDLPTDANNVLTVSFHDIFSSLYAVKKCNRFFAADSCFKTMAAGNKILTYCIVGDHIDQVRDNVFLNPYIDDGIMKVMKIHNANTQLDQMLRFLDTREV